MPAEVDYRRVDLAGEDDLGPVSDGVTHVFHLAGASSSLSSGDEMQQSNVVATERLAASLAGTDVERLVYVSSSSVYGEEEPLPLPVSEDTEPHPSRSYGKAKWQAEQAVWAAGTSGLPVVVLRPVSVYGPGTIKLLASTILDAALERSAGRRELPVHAEPVELRLVHIDDVVRASLHLALCADAGGRAFNVVFPDYPTNHRIVEMVARSLGLTPGLSDDPDCGLDHDQRAAQRHQMLEGGMEPPILLTERRFQFLRRENRNNRLSVDALLSTGFRFGSADLEAPIGATIAWYLDHRWIL
jgi:nucleoside-diphosphate-sugar epimerase